MRRLEPHFVISLYGFDGLRGLVKTRLCYLAGGLRLVVAKFNLDDGKSDSRNLLIRISVVSFTLTSLNDTTEMLFYSLRSA